MKSSILVQLKYKIVQIIKYCCNLCARNDLDQKYKVGISFYTLPQSPNLVLFIVFNSKTILHIRYLITIYLKFAEKKNGAI